MSKQKSLVLVVDDDEDVLLTARMILRPYYKVETANSPKQLENYIKSVDVQVIVLDMNFKTGATSGNEGLFWLRKIKEINPEIEVIMNTAYGDIQLAVECMKEGATDFLVKPWEKEKLLSTVNNVAALNQSRKKINQLESTKAALNRDIDSAIGELVGESAAMQSVYETIKKVAATDANVLILGENGTGKELVARAIHKLSHRNKQNFVKVDLGALSSTLFESELFGHVKGAFTDAKEDQIGRFEMAHEGTLFLDEIGNISLAQQAKLLSVLQNRQIHRVGSSKAIDIDIRLITATNRDIDEMVGRNEFREDLLYRINTIAVELPPLRDRDEDIELLTRHFFEIFKRKYDKSDLFLPKSMVEKLNHYNWPGNVRELQHAVERAVIMSNGPKLKEEDFLISGKKKKSSSAKETLNVEEIEKEIIVKAIEKHNGNLTKAAETLGMGRSTLYRKMNKYKIDQ